VCQIDFCNMEEGGLRKILKGHVNENFSSFFSLMGSSQFFLLIIRMLWLQVREVMHDFVMVLITGS
jgi:hypothetical protein